MAKHTLVIISGPSRVGKTTIVDNLLAHIPSSTRFVTTTTRLPRLGEKNGKDYYFLTREEFSADVERDEFIEWVESYGDFYGTSRRTLTELFDKHSMIFVSIDTRGAFSLKEKFPEAVTIFVKPGSIEELARRMQNGETSMSGEKIAKRLGAVAEKMAQADRFDYIVTNTAGKLAETTSAILEILNKHLV